MTWFYLYLSQRKISAGNLKLRTPTGVSFTTAGTYRDLSNMQDLAPRCLPAAHAATVQHLL